MCLSSHRIYVIERNPWSAVYVCATVTGANRVLGQMACIYVVGARHPETPVDVGNGGAAHEGV